MYVQLWILFSLFRDDLNIMAQRQRAKLIAIKKVESAQISKDTRLELMSSPLFCKLKN